MKLSYLTAYNRGELLSAKEAASILGITSRRLRVLANEGRVDLALFDKEKGWLFPKTDITIRPGKRGPAFGQTKKTK